MFIQKKPKENTFAKKENESQSAQLHSVLDREVGTSFLILFAT